jgi:hypothetical protein
MTLQYDDVRCGAAQYGRYSRQFQLWMLYGWALPALPLHFRAFALVEGTRNQVLTVWYWYSNRSEHA